MEVRSVAAIVTASNEAKVVKLRHLSRLTSFLALLAVWPGLFLTPSARAAPSEKAFRVCIDPGHPSENNDGAALTNGLREVTVNWEIALLLKERLQARGFTVSLTKSTETEFVTNKDRALRANEAAADLFLRLHADYGASSGSAVYHPRKQGMAHGVTGPSPEVLAASRTAATLFHSAFAAALRGKLKDNGLKGEEETLIGARQGALTGSIFSKVPTVLVEMLFLNNASDAKWIKEKSNKLLMADALAAGVQSVRGATLPASKTSTPER